MGRKLLQRTPKARGMAGNETEILTLMNEIPLRAIPNPPHAIFSFLLAKSKLGFATPSQAGVVIAISLNHRENKKQRDDSQR
jgi:hypothetical protein